MQEELPPIYPDYCDVTIPVNIAPLNFLLREDCEAIQISISFPSSGEKEQGRVAKTINTRGNEVVFDLDDWRELMEVSAGKSLDITIAALIKDQWIQYKSFQWHVVSDKVDPYLTYRLIEPDYEIFNHLQIQQRCVENFDVNALGHYEQLENRCMNCHTFANQSPELSMMYVRGPGGGAILNQNGPVSISVSVPAGATLPTLPRTLSLPSIVIPANAWRFLMLHLISMWPTCKNVASSPPRCSVTV